MTVYENAIELAIAPGRWFVELVTGETLEVLTHGYSIHEERYVFSLRFRGSPNFQVTSFSLPVSAVAEIHD